MDAGKRCHFDITSLFSLRERVKENFFFASPLGEVSFLFIQNHNQNHISLSAIFVIHFIALLSPCIALLSPCIAVLSFAKLCYILTTKRALIDNRRINESWDLQFECNILHFTRKNNHGPKPLIIKVCCKVTVKLFPNGFPTSRFKGFGRLSGRSYVYVSPER